MPQCIRKQVVGVATVAALVAGVGALLSVPARVEAAAAPRVGLNNIGGTWIRDRLEPLAEPIPLLPAAKAQADKRKPSDRDPCLPVGSQDMILEPTPFQIVASPSEVKILSESLVYYRNIHMNIPHEEYPDLNFNGDSVARWEGQTLVVDTIGLSDQTFVNGVVPHSEDIRVVERFRRLPPGADGGDRMEVTVTVTDPKTFSKPFVRKATYKRLGRDLRSEFCSRPLIAKPLPPEWR